jgi:hypothetical protein
MTMKKEWKKGYEVIITGGAHIGDQGDIMEVKPDYVTVILCSLAGIREIPKRWVKESKEKVFSGYTKNEMIDAFDLVKNPENWKGIIVAVIDIKEQSVVDAAISFFTGGGAEYGPEEGGKVQVQAPGYHQMIGA